MDGTITQTEKNESPTFLAVYRRLRNLKKKLKGIEALEAKNQKNLKPEQRVKIEKKEQVLIDIKKHEQFSGFYRGLIKEPQHQEWFNIDDISKISVLLIVGQIAAMTQTIQQENIRLAFLNFYSMIYPFQPTNNVADRVDEVTKCFINYIKNPILHQSCKVYLLSHSSIQQTQSQTQTQKQKEKPIMLNVQTQYQPQPGSQHSELILIDKQSQIEEISKCEYAQPVNRIQLNQNNFIINLAQIPQKQEDEERIRIPVLKAKVSWNDSAIFGETSSQREISDLSSQNQKDPISEKNESNPSQRAKQRAEQLNENQPEVKDQVLRENKTDKNFASNKNQNSHHKNTSTTQNSQKNYGDTRFYYKNNRNFKFQNRQHNNYWNPHQRQKNMTEKGNFYPRRDFNRQYYHPINQASGLTKPQIQPKTQTANKTFNGSPDKMKNYGADNQEILISAKLNTLDKRDYWVQDKNFHRATPFVKRKYVPKPQQFQDS